MSIFLNMTSEELTSEDFRACRKTTSSPWDIPGIMRSGLYSERGGVFEVGERSAVYSRTKLKKRPPNHRRPIATFDEEDHSWRIEKYVDVKTGDLIVVGCRWFSDRGSTTKVTIFRITEFEPTENCLEAKMKLEILQEEVYKGPTNADTDLKLIARFEPRYHEAVKKALKIKLHNDYWFPNFKRYKIV